MCTKLFFPHPENQLNTSSENIGQLSSGIRQRVTEIHIAGLKRPKNNSKINWQTPEKFTRCTGRNVSEVSTVTNTEPAHYVDYRYDFDIRMEA
jgi:hypothetical protein